MSRGDRRALCVWDGRPIPPGFRADARYCRKACRQAAHRAKVRRSALEATARPLRLAYADPPYPGMAGLYRDHPDYAGEVDHRALLERLSTFDGWALSTSAAALPMVLALCADLSLEVRVAAWIRGARPHATARIRNGWEPVIYVPARRVGGEQLVDVLSAVPRQRPTLPTSVIGMKPPEFCEWVFGLLGARPGDELADLFPGSGMVTRTWRQFTGAGDDGSWPIPLEVLLADGHDDSDLERAALV